jgi:hypothetical protein
MDLTPLDQAFVDPSRPFKDNREADIVIPPKKRCIQTREPDSDSDDEEPVIKCNKKKVKKELDYSGFSCTHCKKINWYNVIIIALLLYIIFKK